MILLVDHCVWKETENVLRRAGFNCISLRELHKTEANDDEIIRIAKDRKAILITRDRDFSNLTLYPLGSHEGIILLRITPKYMEEVHSVLLETLKLITPEDIKGNLLIITSTTYRLHKQRT
ncbi:MAG: DUF5615 family PIN-like protein [Candidatus Omnitrophica bacterium]|nr:DUF5615 family PIN-like protein [Candidatus Omnitrophota bacterium]